MLEAVDATANSKKKTWSVAACSLKRETSVVVILVWNVVVVFAGAVVWNDGQWFEKIKLLPMFWKKKKKTLNEKKLLIWKFYLKHLKNP